MRRTSDVTYSAMGKTVTVRIGRDTFDGLRRQLGRDSAREQYAVGLFSQARTADGTVLIVQRLLLPDEGDLAEQGAGGVMPTKKYRATAYLIAQQRGLGVIDAHTHPHQRVPRFSGVDDRESAKDAHYVCEHFPSPITHAMLVFDPRVEAHDAVVYDRSLQAFRSIDFLEILGRDTEIRPRGKACAADEQADPRYSRQTMLPGWDQGTIQRQKIVIVGVGGNGAHMLQSLICIGAGKQGWIAVIDPDTIEASNLPRIPYACVEHIGSPKVTVAALYAGRKNPEVKVYPYPCSVTSDAARDRIKGATLLIGAGDGAGIRKVCNEMSVRYQIPYIDLGCEITTENHQITAGGQVRIVVPGENACLVCCNGYDPATAAIELMDDAREAGACCAWVRPGPSGRRDAPRSPTSMRPSPSWEWLPSWPWSMGDSLAAGTTPTMTNSPPRLSWRVPRAARTVRCAARTEGWPRAMGQRTSV